jgi:hypothetical protein
MPVPRAERLSRAVRHVYRGRSGLQPPRFSPFDPGGRDPVTEKRDRARGAALLGTFAVNAGVGALFVGLFGPSPLNAGSAALLGVLSLGLGAWTFGRLWSPQGWPRTDLLSFLSVGTLVSTAFTAGYGLASAFAGWL